MQDESDALDARRTVVIDRRTLLIGAAGALAAGCSSGGTSGADTSNPVASALTTNPATDQSGATTAASRTDPAEESSTAAPVQTSSSESALEPLTPELFDVLSVCVLTAAQAQGPFPSLDLLDRRDVTEGYPGHPTRLGIRVVDSACQPIPGAQVEIWHTDATGDYSSYDDGGIGKDEGAGTTFLRGVQTADDHGIVEFHTIYPGWYPGRAVHIHTRVLVNERDVLTTQLYFDEDHTANVYATADYVEFGLPDTTWATDGLIGDPVSDGTALALTPASTTGGDGTLGLVNLGVSA